MLDLTIKHEEAYKKKYLNTWMQPKYMYYHYRSYYATPTINDSTWEMHDFVSIHNGEIIGNIHYQVDRVTKNVSGLGIICFEDKPSVVFGRDVLQVVKDIFEKFHFRKLTCGVVTANPIMPTYDKLITKYGGRIVGTEREDVLLIDGQYYDTKKYEILASDWFAAKHGG